jgi:guanylate kinase
MRIDVQGAAHIKRIVPDALFIFLAPPSFEAILTRLGNRNTESPEDLQRRIDNYHQEMKAITTFDYVVINHDDGLNSTVDQILAIITTEKLRVQPRIVTL